MPPRHPAASVIAGLVAGLAAGVLAAPGIGLAPADAAGEPCAKARAYGAIAAADLARVGLLDLHPLGLRLGPVAGATVASTRSGMVTDNEGARSAGAARTLDAKLRGASLPTGTLGTAISQQAPPTNAKPATAAVAKRDLGLLRLGSGDLTAHATWQAGMACGRQVGRSATSTAALAGAAVLPGAGTQALVRLPGASSSASTTELTGDKGLVRAVATAEVGLADLRLFSGSLSQVTLKVVEPPTLRVGTGGTRASATVDYDAPVVEISGPGVPTRRLDAPGESVDLAVPSSLPFLDQAKEVAAQQGLPVVGKGTLDDLLDGVARSGGEATGTAGQGQVPLPGLPDTPDLTPAAELIGGTPGAVPAVGSGALSVVRLSIGEVERKVTDRAVRAEAAALRLQVLAGPRKASSVVDLGIGMLSAAAVAPAPATAGYGTPGAPGVPTGGSLPVTGVRAGAVAGTGAVLLAAGAALVIVTRRRRVNWLR
jgi:hypothetical protein